MEMVGQMAGRFLAPRLHGIGGFMVQSLHRVSILNSYLFIYMCLLKATLSFCAFLNVGSLAYLGLCVRESKKGKHQQQQQQSDSVRQTY